MGNTTEAGCIEVSDADTGDCVDSAWEMDDDEPKKGEGEVNIIVREKQTDANSEIYYTI